jgi:quercetin dioxygenase-like cupin family protein
LILTLAAFPVYARDSNSTGVETLARATSSWNGDALPGYPQGAPEVTILKMTIPPKTELPWHKHPFINAGVLLSGELTVVTRDGKTLHLKVGDALVELVDTWHHGVNDGDVPAQIIVFYAGIKDLPITIKQP